MLGSSDYGAQVAAHFGLPYAFAWFFTDGKGGPEALDIYRKLYKPSARHPEPHTALCVWALAAETEEEAASSSPRARRVRLLRDRGIFAPLEPPAVAAAHPYTDAEARASTELRKDSFVGTGRQVAERIASWRNGSTCRRWPSSPGPTTRPSAAQELPPARGGDGVCAGRSIKRPGLRDLYPPLDAEGGSTRFSAASRVG